MTSADRILIEPVVSEKATEASSHLNQYTFKVHPGANAVSIKLAVADRFNVTVKRVNVLNVKPKAKRDRRRRGNMGFKSGYKKAIVTLAAGEAIDLI